MLTLRDEHEDVSYRVGGRVAWVSFAYPCDIPCMFTGKQVCPCHPTVGKCAAVTCMEGHLTRKPVQRYSTEGDRKGGSAVAVRTPVEVAILDLLLHEDTYGPIEPSVFVHAEHTGEMPWEGLIHNRHRLPVHHSVVYLGKGPTALHTPDVPRYAEMARHVFERAGWEAERFDVYRCRIEYPVMPSSIGVAFDLPDAPTKRDAEG